MLQALKSDNSPFTEQQLQRLRDGMTGINAVQAAWLSGYLAGQALAQPSPADTPANGPAAASQSMPRAAVLYASQTGNGETIARQLQSALQAGNVAVNLASVADYSAKRLKNLDWAVFVISTHGEGDPPDDAVSFFSALQRQKEGALAGLNYAILALGDSSYAEFCAAGQQLESHLERLGASAFSARVDCDIDYEQPAEEWSERISKRLSEELKPADMAAKPPLAPTLSIVSREGATPWTRQNPYAAEVLQVQRITGRGSDKDVRHIELSLEDSGIQYQPGDALAVWAPNDPALIDAVLQKAGLDGSENVRIKDRQLSLAKALGERLELTRLALPQLDKLLASAPELATRLRLADADTAAKQAFIQRHQVIDLLQEGHGFNDAQSFADWLRPVTPRSYSIASSQAWAEDEVHLTVVLEQHMVDTSPRLGLASDYLTGRVAEGDRVKVFLEPNPRFRLPDDGSTPLIFIGAGTGVAPYRAFLQELEERGDSPNTWLFFGNPHFQTDFLYQQDWLRYRREGLLNHITVAFSRDQAEKIYLQHRVREQADRLFEWLESGAVIYLCGSHAMGRAVEDELQAVIAAKRPGPASDYWSELVQTKRIRRDLY